MNRDFNKLGYSLVKVEYVTEDDEVTVKQEYELWYRTNRGASHGRFFQTQEALLDVVKTFKRPAVIRLNGKDIGRVWKQDTRWNWYIGL